MAKTMQVSTAVTPALRSAAEEALKKNGLVFSEYLRLCLEHLVKTGEPPFYIAADKRVRRSEGSAATFFS